uniref:NET domain-containing protein n=1 Tax=viral metagenome TaxID=1070528 RepID=A0A6C0KNV6_9ZZZZ
MDKNIQLEDLVSKIDNMEKCHHIEILRIIKESSPNVCISENKNGSFINMNELNSNTIEEIHTYIRLNDTIEEDIQHHETLKNTIIETFIS